MKKTVKSMVDEATAAITAAHIVDAARDELVALAAFVSQREV